MPRTLDRLPQSLKAYCIEHDPRKYTARDHAAWRYIMRRSQPFFREHAVSTYSHGFEKTGLTIEAIPHIDAIDQALQDFGWGAVPVVGFIPPWAFIEFQARKILPIATDMRSVEHIAYTPAPDIVHEAAGHAPILPDLDYSNYLAHYASLGTKAIYSYQDLRLYEAIRYLSDIKEKPESTPLVIAEAEAKLQATLQSFTYVSEQALVARMSWWTAEYGLAGSLKQPKIYGAGLLSSVAESRLALTDKVKKLPLSLDCINYSYNITEPQPQLFVAESMQHLHDVLHELDATLAYRHGGISSLQKALASQAVTSTVLETGLTMSGRLTKFLAREDHVDFIAYEGPVQLCYQGRELEGHGLQRHGSGFSAPLGRFAALPHKPSSRLSSEDLVALGLERGQYVTLRFLSGFEISGRLKTLLRLDGVLAMLTFTDCTVKRGSLVTFEASWGEFDLVLGEEICSVYGGPADREAYGEHEIAEAKSSPGRDTPYSPHELGIIAHYQTLRELRTMGKQGALGSEKLAESLEQLSTQLVTNTTDEWLLGLEICELARSYLPAPWQHTRWMKEIEEYLSGASARHTRNPEVQNLVQAGLQLLT